MAEDVGEKLGKPRPQREDEDIGLQLAAAGQSDGLQRPLFLLERMRCLVAIFAARRREILDQGLDGAPGHQGAELCFVKSDHDSAEIDHREATLQLRAVQLL